MTPETSTHATIRVELPHHLRILAHIDGELRLAIPAPATLRTVLEALEAQFPMLRGTIRDRTTGQRRPFLRFFACRQDISHQSPDDPLPAPIVRGEETLLILGAISGG